MLVVEIVLNGFVAARPCPEYRNDQGRFDRDAIRDHFISKGYRVGEVRGIAEMTAPPRSS